jgi:hypothetical protein
MNDHKVEYVGKDLEAMDFAENYHRWILGSFKPYIGRSLVEVGAGTGSFSELLIETSPESLALVEPSVMFEALNSGINTSDTGIDIRKFNDIFTNVAEVIREQIRPDTFFYINVLEHIENDSLELATVRDCISPGGHVCIFVPALPFLMSEFDRRIGHFRRYTKKRLVEICGEAGLTVVSAKYFDLVGVFPWWLKYRLFRSVTMESGAVRLYDRMAVPLIKPFESLINPPFGKNLILVAKKVN